VQFELHHYPFFRSRDSSRWLLIKSRPMFA
jgi:hypothetical protein